MALAPTTVFTYPLDGSNRSFPINFEYLARKFVQITLIGTDRKVLVINQDFRFVSKSLIQTTLPWGPSQGYETIEVRRYTSATDRLVDFSDGSILRALDLNISTIQGLHIAEEARDLTADTIAVNNNGDLDARGRKITNVADGTDASDAVTMRQVRAWDTSALNSANRAETAATLSTNEAERAKTEANRSRDEADRSKGYADLLRPDQHVRVVDGPINPIGTISSRAGKVLGFNAEGHPVAILPQSGSAAELALDLSDNVDPSKGASMLAKASVNIRSVRALLKVKLDESLVYHTVGYHFGTMRGGGRYMWFPTLNKSLHDGGRFISPTVPEHPDNQLDFMRGIGESQPDGKGVFALLNGEIAHGLSYGLSGDRSKDESTLVQHVIDKNKGKTIVFEEGYQFAFAGVILDGPSYNDTKLMFYGTHYLGVRPANRPANFLLAWVGLGIRDCDGVELTYRGHGQRTLQPDQEHTFNIRLAGVTNFDCPRLRVREFRGDGIYIGQKEHQVDSKTSAALNFGIVDMANSEEDGRNGMSVIACQTLHMDVFRCRNVGGVVGGIRQPGGFDIEPNYDFQTVRDVRIGTAIIHTAGTAGLGVYGAGRATLGGNVDGFYVGSYSVINTNPVDGVSAVYLAHCSNVVMSGYASTLRTQGHRMDATLRIDNVNYADIHHTGKGGSFGVIAGQGFRVVNAKINASVSEYMVAALHTVYVSRSRFLIMAAGGAANSYGIWMSKSGRAVVQEGVHYTLSCPKVGTLGTYAIFNEPSQTMEFANCSLTEGDLTGYDLNAHKIYNVGIGLRRYDVPGLSESISQPTDGTWAAGDIVRRSNPQYNSTNKMILTGWIRLTNGSGHAPTVDWANMFVSDVAPAV